MGFLFEVSGQQKGAIFTAVFNKKHGSFFRGAFAIDLSKLKDQGFDGVLRLTNTGQITVFISQGMKTSLDVDKQYIWDKEKIICNQKVNYYCSKGWIGSIKLWVNNYIKGLI